MNSYTKNRKNIYLDKNDLNKLNVLKNSKNVKLSGIVSDAINNAFKTHVDATVDDVYETLISDYAILKLNPLYRLLYNEINILTIPLEFEYAKNNQPLIKRINKILDRNGFKYDNYHPALVHTIYKMMED
jgi:hypothetical protein